MGFTNTESVFASYRNVVYKWRYAVTLKVSTICGGIPSDPDVAGSWIKTRLGIDGTDPALAEAVSKVMAERQIPAELAAEEVAALKHLNGFKSDANGLFIEGRQLKAALKEATSIAVAAGNVPMKNYGETKKWITKFLPEHVFIVEDTIYLTEPLRTDSGDNYVYDDNGNLQYRYITTPTGIHQRFVATRHGTGIQREEYVDEAYIHFTVISDYDFDKDDSWGKIWVTGEQNGVGAARSQGYGRYEVTRWELLEKNDMGSNIEILAGLGEVHHAAARYAAAVKAGQITPMVPEDMTKTDQIMAGTYESNDEGLDAGAHTSKPAPAKKAAVKAMKSVAKAAAPKKSLEPAGVRPALSD